MTGALPSNPFPGMNPYLERPGLWPDVHTSLIVGLRNYLVPQLQPDYGVQILERVYIAGDPAIGGGGPQGFRIPDAMVLTEGTVAPRRGPAAPEPKPGGAAVAVRLPEGELLKQRYLRVLRADNMAVVAVIEVLSPSNKSGSDRRDYLTKRTEIERSAVHLVEIDLLRAGPPMPVIGDAPQGCYRIIVANGRLRPHADLYAFGLREAIPEFVLPLAKGAAGVGVGLNAVLSHVYSHGSYNMLIDYGQDPEPPLSDGDRVWLDGLLRERGLRGGTEAAI